MWNFALSFFQMEIRRYIKFLGNLFTSQIPYLVLFVTSRCNNKCNYCFNWLNSEKIDRRNELSIQEIARISENMRNVIWLTITGGEPLLRDDIAEICRIFYHNNTRMIALHTNGYLPQKLNRVILEIIRACPDLHLDVCLSLDGIGEVNDEIRGAPDSFKNILESVRLVQEIRENNKNVGIEINTTYSYYTKNHIKSIYDLVIKGLKLSYNFSLVRGSTREYLAKNISLDEFEDFIADCPSYVKQTTAGGYPFASFVTIIRNLVQEISVRNLRQRKQFLPCLAGRRVVVVSDTADVFPCELLPESFGNLRDSNYNLNRLLKYRRAKEILHYIKKGNCYCSWECAIPVNLLYSWQGLYLIMRRWVKNLPQAPVRFS